jgi:ATP-dependent Clp protease ATP-binding subunit ClpA
VVPKPEADVTNAVKKHKRAKPRAAARKKTPKDDKGGNSGGGGGVRTVPKVPLVRA